MSVFDEILCKVSEISNSYVKSLNDDIKVAFECLDKFEEEYKNERNRRNTTQRNKTHMNTLQSIDEDGVSDETNEKDVQKSKEGEKRLSNKRSKQEVEGMSSPEQEKRQKRNASVKAQNNITKQNLHTLKILNQNIILLSDEENEVVNVNLTQKLRREEPVTKSSRRRKEDDKENSEPLLVEVKQEKISLPPEPMELEATLDIQVKQEKNKDDFSMPPPAAPVPKPRKLLAKDKSTDSEEESSGKRTRGRKQNDTTPVPEKDKQSDSEDEQAGTSRARSRRAPDTMPDGSRAARASRRASKQGSAPVAPPEPRPKRTRAKKKASESSTTENESVLQQENAIASPAEKPRPKRTRRGKAAEKEAEKPKEVTPEPEITLKEERPSLPDTQSPAIPMKTTKKNKNNAIDILSDDSIETKNSKTKRLQEEKSLEETRVLCPMNTTVTLGVDKTVVLPNGVYDHTDSNTKIMDATVVLEKINRETLVLEKVQAAIMDATVVIDKAAGKKDGTPNITDDMSILTDDNSEEFGTPPKDNLPPEPTSAVKAKVQQFEEMAARTTRTKTRAMAKKDAVSDTENCTPPDKILSKQMLSADTLTKMNNMIFNGKTAQISVSATKPSAKLPPVKQMPASASKLSAIRARDDSETRGKDDARKKKEAMLEAKKEQQRRKREEKMAAAAAAREAAEKERRAAMQAAARERMEKQAHADQGKIERMKEVEKKKQELARKVAETEERRRAEEQARHARLADEQRKADAARKRQLEDSEAMKKEAAIMAKEIEKRQKEYLEKQKMKQRMEADKMHTPLKGLNTSRSAPAMEPVYMCDGFQYLNSDEDEDGPTVPTPPWCMSKARHRQLAVQAQLITASIDRLFSVRVHSPDLRAIFPALQRRDLKRTSSAVWRTPPPAQPE